MKCMSRYKKTVVAMVACICVAAVLQNLYNVATSVPTLAEAAPLPVIIIDPGHGGVDGGAVSADGVLEKDINLAISFYMRDIFRVNGFEVVMTRETDRSIHDEGVEGVKKQKTSDLHNRLAIVNEHPGAVFISVHQNKFEQRSSHGTQVFFSPNNPGSEVLAEIMQVDIAGALQPGNERRIKKAGKNLYLMTHAKCPAVLLECGFLSNPEEAGRLTDPKYQSQIAFAAFRSVMRYLDLDNESPAVIAEL